MTVDCWLLKVSSKQLQWDIFYFSVLEYSTRQKYGRNTLREAAHVYKIALDAQIIKSLDLMICAKRY
ncbi:hypothetical protein I8748_22525 [Nostoc sp. CENA67]|uniref:Uncharacterized protein n=1 Tax=Amazonocrinis nigriterrae CENA67 TaxID=2794033 RepID=A0A8J7HZ26_9NOST|nr:hypothetical protein [Amazonocrinis nigriterrae]MBH8564924.1 hypothetical protein [Amazonocrinis nigriterrae CENA67]